MIKRQYHPLARYAGCLSKVGTGPTVNIGSDADVIQGLSMSCGICNHQTHSSCFKKHFSPFVPTCPACPCHCLDQQGFSYPIIAIPIPPQRALKGSLSPVNVSAVPGTRATHSLADHLKTYSQPGWNQQQKGRSAGSGTSALGLDTSGTAGDRTPTTTNAPLSSGGFASAVTGAGTAGTGTGAQGAAEARPGFLSKPLAGVWKGWSGDG